MNPRTQSILIIVATLSVGIVIGALAAGAVLNQRVEELQALRLEGGFMQMMERIIEPTDEKQREQIREILIDASVKQMEIRRRMFDEHKELFNEVRQDLGKILNTEQKELLRAWAEEERKRLSQRKPANFMRRRPRRGGTPLDSLDRRRGPPGSPGVPPPRENMLPDTTFNEDSSEN